MKFKAKDQNHSDPFKYLDDNIFVIQNGFSSPKNDINFKIIRDEIEKLFEFGITNKIFLYFKEKKNRGYEIL